jgi:hypothetical protein
MGICMNNVIGWGECDLFGFYIFILEKIREGFLPSSASLYYAPIGP